MTDRRNFLALAGLGAAGLLLPKELLALAPPPVPMTIYKSPSCGCCVHWVTHVNANGFAAKVIDVSDQARLDELKTTSGVPVALRSCHLALVGNYAIEGHVPADLIHRLRSLTPQQSRVLAMLAEGLLNKQIAYELGVSEATIKAHVSAILLKLNVDSRTQAVIQLGKINMAMVA